MFLLFDGLKEGILKLIILMVAGIYKLVSGVYQIFLVLAKTNLFGQESYQHLTEKVYIILAVVMLFVVAYTFITMIVDPDKNKGGKAVEDLIKKVVTSLILIVLCPTLFTFAFDLQDAILDQDIIGKFFTTSDIGYDAGKSIKEGGNMMAGTTFAAFFYPAYASRNAENIVNQSNKGKMSSGEYKINCAKGKCTLQEAIDYATHTGEFSVFTAFAGNWLNDDDEKVAVDFSWLLALIAGGYLVYVLVSFCFDLALRVIKLAFYQIVAPICIACRILPDKESIFKNWWKAVGKTYLSVFIRIFIMNLAVFLLVELTKTNFWSSLCDPAEMECGGVVKTLAFAFLVMGLLTFIKQSSKLIDEIFGLGDVKLGIGEKFKEATHGVSALGAGAAAVIAGRGNPMAFKRGYKNGWKAVGQSAQEYERYRHAVETEGGHVRARILGDKVRQGFGFRTYADQLAEREKERERTQENIFEHGAYDENGHEMIDAHNHVIPIAYTDENGHVVGHVAMDENGNIVWNVQEAQRLEDQKNINVGRMTVMDAQIEEINKHLSDDNDAIKMRSNVKGEAEKRVKENKTTATINLGTNRATGADEIVTGTFEDIIKRREELIKANNLDVNADFDTQDKILDQMAHEAAAEQIAAAGSNGTKKAALALHQHLTEVGDEFRVAGDDDARIRWREVVDEHTGLRTVTSLQTNGDNTQVRIVYTQQADGSYIRATTNLDANGHQVGATVTAASTDYDLFSDYDKNAKTSAGEHEREIRTIEGTQAVIKEQNSRIDRVIKTNKEQVAQEVSSPEHRAARAASTYAKGGDARKDGK